MENKAEMTVIRKKKKTNSWKTKANCFSKTKEWNKKTQKLSKIGGKKSILVTKQKIQKYKMSTIIKGQGWQKYY